MNDAQDNPQSPLPPDHPAAREPRPREPLSSPTTGESCNASPLVRFSVALHAAAVLALVRKPRQWRPVAALLAADHLALCIAGMWPRSRLLGPNISHFHDQETAQPWVALTFDDGPDPKVTPKVLGLLAERQVTATFFCIGRHAAEYPELVHRIIDEGHRIENHTYHHWPHFSFLGSRGQEREIGAAQEILRQLTGRAPLWFRAPAGIQNPLLGPVLCRLGLRLVSWTRRGFDAVERNPRKVVHRLQQNLHSGDILVLHDGFGPRDKHDRAVVLESLPRLLDVLEKHGLQPKPLPDPTALPHKALA